MPPARAASHDLTRIVALGSEHAALHDQCRRRSFASTRRAGRNRDPSCNSSAMSSRTKRKPVESVVDAAQTVEAQLPEAVAHRVADDQCAADHGRRDHHAEHDRQMHPPVEDDPAHLKGEKVVMVAVGRPRECGRTVVTSRRLLLAQPLFGDGFRQLDVAKDGFQSRPVPASAASPSASIWLFELQSPGSKHREAPCRKKRSSPHQASASGSEPSSSSKSSTAMPHRAS